MNYELESIALVTTFAHYAKNRGLPAEFFGNPDYIALQASDIGDFQQRVKETEPRAEQITVVQEDDRFVATIKLVGALGVSDLGRVKWLEIVEPRPQELELGISSGDTVGFFYPDFERVGYVLRARDVPYIIDEEPTPAIKACFNHSGDEFVISNTHIEAIVDHDIETERATVVRLAA